MNNFEKGQDNVVTSACACISVSSGFINQGPRNIAVIAGSNATFTCGIDSADDRLCWHRTDPDLLLCNSAVCRPRYNATATQQFQFHSFKIDSCISTDAARYNCSKCTDDRVNKAADLIVLRTLTEVFSFLNSV